MDGNDTPGEGTQETKPKRKPRLGTKLTTEPDAVVDAQPATDEPPDVADAPADPNQRTLILPVKLTLEEQIAIGIELAKALHKWQELDEEKARVAKAYKGQLEGLDSKIDELRDKFEGGVEEREVPIREDKDLFARRVRVFRLDTGELVTDRSIAEHELQTELAFAAKAADTDAPKNVVYLDGPKVGGTAEKRRRSEHSEAADEQIVADTPDEAEQLRADRLAAENAARAAEAGDAGGHYDPVSGSWVLF